MFKELGIMKKNIISNNTIMKANKYIALVLMVLGLSVGSKVFGAVKILEATGFQAINTQNNSTNTNNTWSPYTESGTYGTCTTTANGVTITSSNMTIYTTYFKIKEGKSFTISVSSGGIYRIVFKPKDSGNISNNFGTNGGSWGGNSTWQSGASYWGFTNGKSSVTFTNNFGTDFSLYSINVYTYRDPVNAAEASISLSSFTVTAETEETKYTKLTTNLGSFDGADYPYTNNISCGVGVSEDDIDFDGLSGSSYGNNSNLDINIYPYNPGTYTGEIMLGTQTSSDQANNYHMLAIWASFTVTVNDACTTTPTLSFATTGTINKKRGDANFTNAASSTPGTGTTKQTITYSSSDTDVATVNSSTGEVTLGTKCGTTTITASVESNKTYCATSTSYTLNLTGYDVTFHYPACAESSPSNLTNQYGSVSLEKDMAVPGYHFAGWTDHAVTTNPSSVTPLYTSSVSVTANTDLYAVYSQVSNTFNKITANTTLDEGDYVLSPSYVSGDKAKVMTNTLDGSKRMVIDNDTYTFTDAGLTCTDDDYIWHITPTGNTNEYTVYNASSGKYLGANSGSTSSSDRQMRLEDAVSNNYQKWIIAQKDNKTVPFQVENVGREAKVGVSNNSSGDHWIGFFNSVTAVYFFKRTASAGTFTSSPSCDMDEVTVTIQNQVGGTVVASGTGGVCVWSSPVLSQLYGGETVTITATPATGYNFTSWTVVSGGATLSSTSTATATFTMPENNVVIRPNYTAQEYTVTYRDKGDNSYSGDAIASSYNTYTYGVGLTLPEATKTDYVFMGWYAETDCSGSRVTSISTSDYGNKTFYALWMQYSEPLAWCPEPEVHLENTSTDVYVTNQYDGAYSTTKGVMAVNTLNLRAINLVPGSTVRLSTPASSGVYFTTTRGANFTKGSKPTATIDVAANGSGVIDNQTIYVHYLPAAAGTNGAPTDVTVTAEYQTNTDYYSTQDIHVRNLPSQFVIAAKVGGSWYALPGNIASATNPAAVQIEVDETNWTAKGESTLAYTLWPVKTTYGDGDQYETYGEWLRFAGASTKALWTNNSATANTINNNATITSLGVGADADAYRWAVTTTNASGTWKYTLKTDQSTNKNYLNLHNSASGLIWGSYSSDVATNELYLLPFTVIEPITMKVVEWYPTKVLVKTASDISGATVSINGTPVEKTITKKSGTGCELYEISGLSTLTSNPTKTLTVSYTSGSTYSASVKIPVIIWESQNLVNPSGDPVGGYKPLNEPFASLTKEVYSYADLVVRDGATLTINGTNPQNTFYDVTIYPTSKISVPATNANGASNVFNIHSLTFFGGIDEIYNGSSYTVNKYGVPELSLKGNFGSKTVSTINYDMRVDDSQMYSLTVPYDVDLADITYWDGTEMTLGDQLWVSAYDGQARANKDMAHTWIYETDFASKLGAAKLKQGVGYTISADYQASMGNQTSIIRLSMKSNVAANATEAAKTVPVTAYVNTQGVTVGDNNKGWNLVGNPYMVSINGGEPGSQMVVGKLVESGTGPWDWDGKTYPYRYVTIPFDDGTDYYQMKFEDATLRPFKNFFVQIDNTTDGNALGFALASRQDAPGRFLQLSDREVEFEILLSNGSRQDNLGMLIADKYSPAYEINADLEKMIGTMSVYTIFGGYNLAYNALSPDDAAELIPVGYVAPTAGTYTFDIDEESDVSQIEHIFLTDYERGTTVDLLDGSYEFETSKSTNNSRFALNVILKEEQGGVLTGLEEIGDASDSPVKFIYRDKMYILNKGVIYDATGKKVREINK